MRFLIERRIPEGQLDLLDAARGQVNCLMCAAVGWGLFFLALAAPQAAGVVVLSLVVIVGAATWPNWRRL